MIRKSVTAVAALAAVSVGILAALTLAPSSAGAQPAAAPLCPSTMPGGVSDLQCTCPATDRTGSVWGTDTYTDDSALCAAAVHAGVIPAAGGVIRAQAAPGRDSYSGSLRNGVSTSHYGSWSRSVVFVGTALADAVPLCPGAYHDAGKGWSSTCRCADGSGNGGSVWGSGPYTTDSNLCRAARHAGVIGAGGGLVRVTSAPGQASYTGSRRNGVETLNWGSYEASFRVSAPGN